MPWHGMASSGNEAASSGGWAREVCEMKLKARQRLEDDVGDEDQQQAQFYEGEEVDSE